MENKLFFADIENEYTFNQLLEDINSIKSLPKVINENNTYNIFIYLILSIITEKEIVLLDSDLSGYEIEKLNLEKDNEIEYELNINDFDLESLCSLSKKISDSKWQLTLFTSGTTGSPKRVKHSLNSLTKFLKVEPKRQNDIWALAYNPTHIAGIQVFFQAFFNLNSVVNVFNLEPKKIIDAIKRYRITNISATPTFYNLLLAEIENEVFEQIKTVTFGGEKFLNDLTEKLKKVFPLAKINNIYASTEAGSLFVSNGESFTIKDEFKDLIKFVNNELVIHRSIIAEIENFNKNEIWYHTGDLVEIISDNPIEFKFLSRVSDFINVGGYNVSPYEVEDVIRKFPDVVNVRVYGIKNKITQNILAADIVTKFTINENHLKQFLNNNLQNYKIPRIINFVENLDLTRTGKIKRQ